jgi:cytidine deaminase
VRRASRRGATLHHLAPRAAALATPGGAVFTGCDIPGSDRTGVGTCAERAAVFQAVLAGRKRFRELLVRAGRSGARDGGPPCGACLQVLVEFSPAVRVWWGTEARPRGGITAAELLPAAFSGYHLRRARSARP